MSRSLIRPTLRIVSELPTLAVTGSTGGLGGRIARRLAASDVEQRLLVRDPSRAPVLDGAVPVAFRDYEDHDSVVAALQGVTTLFMVSAAENEHRLAQHHAFVDAAAEAGVRHLVYTSFSSAAEDSTFTLGRDHYSTEERVRASGMDWTFLRDNFYIDVFPYFVGEDGVIRGPAGDGAVAAVARDDIAASAAEILSRPGAHVGSTYVMTGPGGAHAQRDRGHDRPRAGTRGLLPRRDRRGGLRVTPSVGRPRLAVRRVGQHLHRDRRR